MPQGLQPHTHEEREKIIELLVPQIKERFGDNLVALAATASFARGDDGKYSDLELTVFLKERTPREREKRGTGLMYEGMLIELVWTTEQEYLEQVKNSAHEEWFLAGSDVLKPVINPEFINKLANAPVRVTQKDCFAQLNNHWADVQESTSKVLKAIERMDMDALPLMYWDMVRHTLIALSFLNCKPYTTFARFVSEAREFPKKPSTFEQFVNPLKEGFGKLEELEQMVLSTFGEMEMLLDEQGVKPYAKELKLFRD